ncbi:hypothetical protein C8J57DRAFT_1673510 [Mycena rebaudengoi]|nr:hypothetical protein C8J57DRAFT_1673510 [Mycena rebaudengoi]
MSPSCRARILTLQLSPSFPQPPPDVDDLFQWEVDSDGHLPREPSIFCFSSDSEDDSLFPLDPPNSYDEQDANENGDVNIDDIKTDPLFRSQASLFDRFQAGSEPEPEDDTEPWAFDDHPAIQNAYIRAFVGAAFEGMTHNAVANMLAGSLVTFKSAEAVGAEFPGLAKFARTLGMAEKRLGVCTDTLIIYYFACAVCWKAHYPTELPTLPSPACDAPNCSGRLFSVKRLASGGEKHTPLLSVPFVLPEIAIRRMCLQPGKVAQWQEWHTDLDQPGQRKPSAQTGYDAFDDLDKPMTNITDGRGWRAMQAGLERCRNGKWEVHDVDVHELKQQFIALPNGLIIQINIDWFQAVKGGCHSLGAMYMTICNNPHSIQFLCEETSLLQMFPGPHKPNSAQYNNVMKMFIKAFKKSI